ncbi:TonB-dependent receptor [Escherichia coli]|nr:TonB-dependent receptor [Escherichia coli]
MKIVFVRQTVLPALLVLSPVVFAADEQTMIVSAAPQVVSELDTPAAVSVVDGEEMRLATPRINLSESLTSVPGLQVQNRQNYAQDLQLSIRGFGSRSTYGIRGIRLYVDGIPATMPDGQGQTSNIDLSSVQNVEVLRGPFSALYGNASGGVMNVTTQTGQQPPTIEASSYYGSFGSWRYGLKDTIEIGSKTRIGDGLLSLALFQTDTDDEIVVDSSSGGRTTYKNAGKTRRQGAELAWDQRFAGDFRVNASWTWLDATYRSNVCNEQDCNGNRMPGIARNMGFASIGYVPEDGWYAGTEARYMGDIMADDENTAKAPSYTLVGLFTGYKYNYHNLTVDLFGRVDNLFDKQYVGSVIVNESNGRYYEPSPGRNYGVGMNIAWRFE